MMHVYHSVILDKVAEAIGLVRAVGENNLDFLERIRCYYGQRPYTMYLPLLNLLQKLELKSTCFLLAKVPEKWTP
jgi:hypothetical protein